MPHSSFLTSANHSHFLISILLCLVGKMNTKDTGGTHVLAFLNATTELVPLSSMPNTGTPDSLLIIIAVICIFLFLATCLIFLTLYKPAALDQSCHGPHECMPHHPEDASEPQLRLWKRLGSLRNSIRSNVKRSRPVSQANETCSRKMPARQDWNIMESTEMWPSESVTILLQKCSISTALTDLRQYMPVVRITEQAGWKQWILESSLYSCLWNKEAEE